MVGVVCRMVISYSVVVGGWVGLALLGFKRVLLTKTPAHYTQQVSYRPAALGG
jgi:hypothetical protein